MIRARKSYACDISWSLKNFLWKFCSWKIPCTYVVTRRRFKSSQEVFFSFFSGNFFALNRRTRDDDTHTRRVRIDNIPVGFSALFPFFVKICDRNRIVQIRHRYPIRRHGAVKKKKKTPEDYRQKPAETVAIFFYYIHTVSIIFIPGVFFFETRFFNLKSIFYIFFI